MFHCILRISTVNLFFRLILVFDLTIKRYFELYGCKYKRKKDPHYILTHLKAERVVIYTRV